MAPVTSKNNLPTRRASLGASHSSAAKSKDLFGDESVAGGVPENFDSNRPIPLADFIIQDDQYDYPLEESVPPGYYASKIKKVSGRYKNGKAMLDVSYMFENPKTGKIYYVLQTYPRDTKPYKDFCRAMIQAGIKPGPNMKDIIGVTEKVQLAYWSKTSDIGSIVQRVPHDDPEFPDGDEDPDYDDFLPEEDD